MALNFNVQPFFDDYSADKKFYRILFRAGYAVQARELTQLQTIIQQQVKRFGDHMFVNGAMIIPGQLSYDVKTPYVRLQEQNAPTNGLYTAAILTNTVNSPIGKIYYGVTSGIQAIILKATVRVSSGGVTESDTLFVKYVRGNGTFTAGETLKPLDGSSGIDLLVEASSAVGVGSTASIEAGVYYIKDNFVLVEAQTTVLSKYSSTPTIKAGLQVNESVIYPETDESILDNALGSYNYAAPGAARYSIDLVLTTVPYAQTIDTTTFIPLITLLSGQVQFMLDKTIYSELEKTMARRTADESGDYTVRDFPVEVKDYRNNFRGAWAPLTTYVVGDIVETDNFYKCILGYTSGAIGSTFSVGSNWLKDTTPPLNYGLYDGVTLLTNRAAAGATGISGASTTDPTTNIAPDNLKISLAVGAGKAYVKGYEVEKVSTQYLTMDKARDVSSTETAIIDTSPGNYVLVNNVNSLSDINNDVAFYDTYGVAGTAPTAGTGGAPVLIATGRVRQIQYHSSGVYKVFLFNIVTTVAGASKPFSRYAKYMFSVGTGSTTATRFSARIVPQNVALKGQLTVSTTSATVAGVNTTFTSDLVIGDYVMIGTAGPYRIISAVSTDTSITIDTAISIVAGTSIYRVENQLYLPALTNAAFNIPRYALASTQDIKYSFYEKVTVTGTSPTASVTLSKPGYTFGLSSDPTNYIVVDPSGVIVPTVTVADGGGNSSATISWAAGTGTSTLIYNLNKTASSSTANLKQLTSITDSALTVSSSMATLSKPDVFEIQAITKGSVDITSKFNLDNGQRDTHYDLGTVTLKPNQYLIDLSVSQYVITGTTAVVGTTFIASNLMTGDTVVIAGNAHTPLNGTWTVTYITATTFSFTITGGTAGTYNTNMGTAKVTAGTISVAYSYFARLGGGDYFSVNSYTHGTSNVLYSELDHALINALDFRPTKNSDGSITGVVVPKYTSATSVTYSYYLGRTDKLSIGSNGALVLTKGVSATSPQAPTSPSNSMDLYKFYVEPYTFSASPTSIVPEKIENKRYTMRDIGNLETRVKNLEYYTALSELEQNTLTVKSYDSYGLERPQNGFMVDSFTGQGIGDVTSPDWIASINIKSQELRPFFTQQQVALQESVDSGLARVGKNYEVNGDIVTLKIASTTPLVKQLRASHAESVNPFNVYSFTGDVELTPWSDTWFEVNRRPDVIINNNSQYDAVVNQAAASGVLGTVWNSWQQVWSGVTAVNQDQSRWFDVNGNIVYSTAAQVGVVSASSITTRASGTIGTISSTTTTTTINDKLLSLDVVPYIRPRGVIFKGSAFKPETTMHAFFDQVPVDTYISPAKKLAVTAYPSGTVPTFKTNVNFGSNINVAARKEIVLPYFKLQYNGRAADGFGYRDNSGGNGSTVADCYFFTPLNDPISCTGQGWLPGKALVVHQSIAAGTLYAGSLVNDVPLGTTTSYGEYTYAHPIYIYLDGIRVAQNYFIGATNIFNVTQHVPISIVPVGAVYNASSALAGVFATGATAYTVSANWRIRPSDWTATYLDGTVKTFSSTYNAFYYNTTVVTNSGSVVTAINTTTGEVTITSGTGNITITWVHKQPILGSTSYTTYTYYTQSKTFIVT